MKEYKIAVLPGDGIGPEIVPEAIKVLDKVGEMYGLSFSYEEGYIGGAAIDAVGESTAGNLVGIKRRIDIADCHHEALGA